MSSIIKLYESLSEKEKFYVKELIIHLTAVPTELLMSYNMFAIEKYENKEPKIYLIYMIATIISSFIVDKDLDMLKNKGRII